MQSSLRLRLLVWMLLPLLAVASINLLLVKRSARAAADEAYDRILLAAALSIADNITIQDDAVKVDIPYSALEMFQSQFPDHVYYRISHADGRLITGYDDLPISHRLADDKLGNHDTRFYEARYKGEIVRMISYAKPLYEPSGQGPVVIQIGETLRAREEMAREILSESVRNQILLVLAAVALAVVGGMRGLRPLMRLAEQVKARRADELEPFNTTEVQYELRPFIAALNQHMARLKGVFEVQRRFIADAAHQLRTPLAVVHTQAEHALRQTDINSMREEIECLLTSTRQTVHLGNQLLTLSRAQPDAASKFNTDMSLANVARDATRELAPLARKRNIELSFECSAEAETVIIRGNRTLLHELVVNLLNNALRYTQAGGEVTVDARIEGNQFVLEVQDNGPGIPPSERELVFDRFYRVLGTDVEGCGLGLAIVREIIKRHEGEIALQDATKQKQGLRVITRFPLLEN
ncbi:sensor histidine kinase [Chitinimonas sp. BJB300]|uniref:sensor histidine kinase n=1 Tax=Chitinimonas sp. BJB300 TaxID=1559339 RepID=UPI000C0FA2AF|nr:sensor histidine kinase [Chitinimonas sp. BJB300]PHV11056.1 sensor histidine kinase [Chitinimonas sp. BJB300]TSJ90084.1 sensor histidine kinase [Chitinimonas sp. BJB300]